MRVGLVPRHRLAAGADPAPPRPRRPLRVRLPDPARARREAARRPGGRRRRLHRPARLGRGLSCPAPAGSGSIRPPACSPARATSRSPRRPLRQRRADHRQRTARPRSSSAFDMRRHAHPRDAARHASRTREQHWQAILDAPAQPSTQRLAAGDVRLTHGRRADLRRRSTTARRRSGTSPRSARPSATTPTSWCAACASASPRAACCTTARASGIRASSLPRWAYRPLLAHRRRAALADPDLIAAERPRRRMPRSRDAQHFAERACRAARPHRRTARSPAYEDAGALHAGRAEAAARRDAGDQQARRPAERERIMRVFDRGLDEPGGYVLPILRLRSPRPPAGAGSRSAGRFGRGHLFLLPGDLPVGLRLPLAVLPEIASRTIPTSCRPTPGRDRAAARSARTQERRRSVALRGACRPAGSTDGTPAGTHRAGRRAARRHLCVFMPPLADAEDYAALLAAIEDDRRRRPGCRSTSKATRRRPTRASTSSRSRPIPA